MFGNFQQWIILLVTLVPGFIVTGIQRGFRPKHFATQFDWFTTSILYGIFLNAAVFIIWLITVIDYKSFTIEEAFKEIETLQITSVLLYLLALYLLAIIWGFIIGKWRTIGIRAILNRFGLTRYAEHSSVWERVFDKQVPMSREMIWIKISLEKGATLFGRLRYSSANVEQDKPIEVYISPYYEMTNDGWKRASLEFSNEESDGIYLKIVNEHSVEFFYRKKDWSFAGSDKK